jgi:hypothetical protein
VCLPFRPDAATHDAIQDVLPTSRFEFLDGFEYEFLVLGPGQCLPDDELIGRLCRMVIVSLVLTLPWKRYSHGYEA